jgi:hypothetical protein
VTIVKKLKVIVIGAGKLNWPANNGTMIINRMLGKGQSPSDFDLKRPAPGWNVPGPAVRRHDGNRRRI